MKRANGKCEICGRPGVECHEKWIYDDQDHKQKLTGFEIVCKDCHLVHHYGRAVMQGLGEKARVHFEKVNGLGDQEALRAEHPASISEDADFWYVHVTYAHSQHSVTIGGSNTIPEFPSFLLLTAVFMIVIAALRRKRPSD